ncbi:MAG: AMP-binding protein [Deltaproteobacteria bacterium]|nr:AMP-binding protein [Candidatus Deferrimicrobiaceae bacterium]
MTERSGNIWDNWLRHLEKTPDGEAIIHWVADGGHRRWTWGELFGAAARYAIRMRGEGVREGDICALIIRHHEDFYPLYMGISLMGAIPSILAYPNPRLHPDKFRQGLEGMAHHSGLDWIFTERALEDAIRPLVRKETTTIRGLFFPLDWEKGTGKGCEDGETQVSIYRRIAPEKPCLLQHSSGTTGLQKAVVLSHRAVLDHLRQYGAAIRPNGRDKVISWLPLYHDMGLIAAFHLPLALGIPLVQMDPFEWVQFPGMFLDAVSREKGTLAWLPNFAYNIMADRIREADLDGVRLDSVRMLINCSEPVRHESHEKFLSRFSAYGLKTEALAACYAMAETTFAATQTEPGKKARTLVALRDELARGRYEPHIPGTDRKTKPCVSSGPPVPGCSLKVIDEKGEELPDGRVGEIVIRSESMFDGYRNQREKTNEVLKGNWYYSGDYGFRHEGEYYVIGRKKDIIIVAGHNIAPEDVEDAVNEVPGVLPGRSVAFGVDDPEAGTEQVRVVAETADTTENGLQALRRAIAEAGIRINVAIARVYLVPPRWLIKSSSGKLSRKANRQRVLETFPDR